MNKFLDKVVEFLLKDTEISNEEGDRSFSPPFTSIWYSPDYLPHQYDRMLKHGFFYYCKNTYGLTDEETKIVWDEYKRNILNKFKNSGSINESSDKQNKFLDKVVELLVKDTIIDYELENLTPPFFDKYRHDPSYDFYTFVYPFWDLDMDITPNIFLRNFIKFENYCKDTYGLTDEETNIVWDYYWKKIHTTIKRYFNPINESSDKQNKFLDKVVELLVRGTILDYVNKTWTSPYIKPLFKYSYPSFDFILYTFHPFSNYCEDNYNLTEDEIFYVWRRYKEIILDKMNNSGSINESSDRKYL